MPIVRHAELPVHELPGLRHRTLAARDQGLATLEVWHQVMVPGAETPVHRHACEEVIVILAGRGRVVVEGETSDFGPDTTLVVPPDVVHQIVNTGDSDLVLRAAFGTAPVQVRTAAGDPQPLPWDAPRA